MKSKTSFFNPAVFRKNLSRYFPLWLLYTILLVLVLYPVANGFGKIDENLIDSLSVLGGLNFIYGSTAALLLFHDLFSFRSCAALHAMPLKRDCWFCTNLISGFLFGLIPYVTATIAALLWGGHWAIALAFLMAAFLQFFVFFGIGVFCVMLSGNPLGCILLDGFFCLCSVLVFLCVNAIYLPMLPGLVGSDSPFMHCSPFMSLVSNYGLYGTPLWEDENWQRLFLYAGISFLLLIAAFFLYRKRQLECAGDFLAFRATAPVLQLLVTPLCGALLYQFLSIFDVTSLLFFFVGMLLVFFSLEMLLTRSLKVFHLRQILSCAVLFLAVGISLFVTKLDVLGLVNYIPDTSIVTRAYISANYYYDVFPDLEEAYHKTEDIQALHHLILSDKLESANQAYIANSEEYFPLDIHYSLNNGSTVHRRYRIICDSEAGLALKAYSSRYEFVLEADSQNLNPQDVTFFLNNKKLTNEETARFYAAVKQDAAEGHMSQIRNFDAWAGKVSTFQWITDNGKKGVQMLYIPSDAANLNALFEEWGIEEDYYVDREYKDEIIYG